MRIARRLPLWLWWFIGLAAIAAIVAGVIFVQRLNSPRLPAGLAELREHVAKILEESGRIEDVDIKPLVDLEVKKDYAGAVALMDKALAANASLEAVAESLAEASAGLTKLAVQVKPDDIATKAIEAFGALDKLAQAEKKFYEDRRMLYEVTRSYYADLAAKKSPAIPENLPSLVETVNADLKRAEELRETFSTAIKAFDEAVAGR